MTDNIEILSPELSLEDSDRSAILALGGADEQEELMEMIARFESVARPKALYGVFPVEAVTEEGVTINGVSIKSQLMSKNMASVGRVFPYVATCGTEVEQLAAEYKEPLTVFWADEIMKRYLGRMIGYHREYLKKRFDIRNKIAAMNPGSIKEWPLTGQRELFNIFGGLEAVEAAIGVRLTKSMLMLPSKSVSGICFLTDTDYENCSRCPIVSCPNRRAEYIPELY